MPYKYPDERRRIVAISGIFDAFEDAEISKVKWYETWKTGNMQWDVLSAPGGVGGNALWMKGTIGNGIGMQGKGHLSPYPNTSNQYLNSPDKPFRIKNRAEFMMRIVQDQTSPNAKISHAAGFVLDGAVKWTDDHNVCRSGVYFSVANQRAGLSSGSTVTSKYDVAWSGVVDTWYNIRIEWEWDWFERRNWLGTDWEQDQTTKVGTDAYLRVFIKVYVNNSLLIDHYLYKGDWRDTSSADYPQSLDLGRPGVGLSCENDDTGEVSNGTFVEAWFKDILITQNIKTIDWSFTNSMIHRGAERLCKAIVYADFPESINRGQDIQIHARDSISDDWTGQFRGIIRSASRTGKVVTLEAEGYDSVLAAEKSEVLSFTAKTAKEIITDAVNKPDEKPTFDVTTFFDSAATTYNREYIHLPKLDIMLEMTSLENFTLYLDMANAWHFEKLTNARAFTDIHLEYNVDFGDYSDDNIFIRSPNIIRVVGSGFVAQKEVAAEQFVSGSKVVREISRLDLTTQAEVDDALAYYSSAYIEPYKILTIIAPAKYAITPAKFIRVTIEKLGYNYMLSYVLSVEADLAGTMTLTIMSLRFDVSAFLSDINYRQESKEGQDFPQDLTPSENRIDIEGVATFNIYARFFITEYYSGSTKVVREGKAVITNTFLDDLNDLFLTDTVPAQPNPYEYIHWGTGTTPAKEDDTQIETAQDKKSVAAPLATNDGYRIWGGAGGSSTELGSVLFYNTNIMVTDTMANVTEMTLQETSSPTSKMALRANFASYTPASKTDVEIHVVIGFVPVPGACYPTTKFLVHIVQWLRDQPVAFAKIKRIALFGTDTFTYPAIWLEEESETSGKVVTCPALASQVSLTTTQLKDKFMIKYEQTDIFEYDERYNSADGDQSVAWIGASSVDNSLKSYINIFFRTQKLLSEFDGYTTNITIWLKFARGDTDIRKWLCTPRVLGGACV